MSQTPFRIAIIGSGPIGKLLACSATPHPLIQITQYEADVLPLRPSFGYGVGPQTLHAIHVLNPPLGKRFLEKCYTDKVWMHWWHGGEQDCHISDVQVPDGKVFGRVGREEFLELLDDSSDTNIRYGKKLVNVGRIGDNEVELTFQDGTKDVVNAVWAADGVNSLCRKLVQGDAYEPPSYTGFLAYRGKVEANKVADLLGSYFAARTCCFIGVKGWHVLIFPIENGTQVNIAAFCVEPESKPLGREPVSLEELLAHYPGRNATVDMLLRVSYLDNVAKRLLTYIARTKRHARWLSTASHLAHGTSWKFLQPVSKYDALWRCSQYYYTTHCGVHVVWRHWLHHLSP